MAASRSALGQLQRRLAADGQASLCPVRLGPALDGRRARRDAGFAEAIAVGFRLIGHLGIAETATVATRMAAANAMVFMMMVLP